LTFWTWGQEPATPPRTKNARRAGFSFAASHEALVAVSSAAAPHLLMATRLGAGNPVAPGKGVFLWRSRSLSEPNAALCIGLEGETGDFKFLTPTSSPVLSAGAFFCRTRKSAPVRAGDQPQDRESARPRNANERARPRRRGDRMIAAVNRREFISLLAGTAAWPLAARAQQPAMPVIGVLSAEWPDLFTDRLRVFHDGLRETGYVEGQNLCRASRGGKPIHHARCA